MTTFIPATVNAVTNPTVFGFYIGDAWDRDLTLDNQTVLQVAGLPQSMLVTPNVTLNPNENDLFNALYYDGDIDEEFALLCYLGAKQMNWEPSAKFDTEAEAVAFVNGMSAIRWDTNATRYLDDDLSGSSLIYWDTTKNITKQQLTDYVANAFDLLDNE